jgi:hypothetical protein
MSRRRAFGPLLSAVVAALVGAHPADGATGLTVTVDRARIATRLGDSFEFRSTITNRGPTAASGLIAHLNVVSLRGDVYVDPEDWSPERTQYLGPIPPGRSRAITWRMRAVNAGRLGVYVAVLRGSPAAGPPTTGPTIDLAVAQRETLDSGGILPLALGIPALLGLLTVGFRLRRRG